MPRYIEENDIYKLVTPTGKANIHCSQIDELPRADVVPRSEVEKIFADIFALCDNAKEKLDILFNEINEYRKGYENSVNHFRSNMEELKKKYKGD